MAVIDAEKFGIGAIFSFCAALGTPYAADVQALPCATSEVIQGAPSMRVEREQVAAGVHDGEGHRHAGLPGGGAGGVEQAEGVVEGQHRPIRPRSAMRALSSRSHPALILQRHAHPVQSGAGHGCWGSSSPSWGRRGGPDRRPRPGRRGADRPAPGHRARGRSVDDRLAPAGLADGHADRHPDRPRRRSRRRSRPPGPRPCRPRRPRPVRVVPPAAIPAGPPGDDDADDGDVEDDADDGNDGEGDDGGDD